MVPKRTNEALDSMPEQNGKRHKPEEPEHALLAPELQLALALPAPQGVPDGVQPHSAPALPTPQTMPQHAGPLPASAQPAEALPPQPPLPLDLEQQPAHGLPPPQPVLKELQPAQAEPSPQTAPSSLELQPAAHAELHPQAVPNGAEQQSAPAERPPQTVPQHAEPQPARALLPAQPVLRDLDAQLGHKEPPSQTLPSSLDLQPTAHAVSPPETVLQGLRAQPKHELQPAQPVPENSDSRPGPVLPPLQAMPKGLELPSGWRECPAMGHRIGMLRLVPTKVPLGKKFRHVLTEEQHFSPETLVQTLRAKGIDVGLIIDLTNSWRYYDPDEVTCLGVEHLKIRCKGRGEAPEPQAVNQFVWEVVSYTTQCPHKWMVVHCTHGFNRTGYMIVSMLMRRGMNLEGALLTFKQHRPAGIYKDEYIRALYKYYHEPMPPTYVPPALPSWKLEEPDSPKIDHELDAEENGTEEAEPHGLQHDDDIGEEITFAEAQDICQIIVRTVRGMAPDEFLPENWMNFPGSQPVSLDRQNLALLGQERYGVTWKADGTRYMLLIQRWGAYLVDRSFKVRRVQMRFPLQLMTGKEYHSHHNTLLDGELVVDEETDSGKHFYQFLVYDIMAINCKPVVHLPWKTRWQQIEDSVMKGRAMEQERIKESMAAKHPSYPVHYEYDRELFRIRRKEFWPLSKAKWALQEKIPTLSHESDGLIFQARDEPYVVGTDVKLLKWKYGSMNSVDFLLRSKAAGPELYLGKGSDIALLPGAKVEFAEGEDVRKYENSVVECAFDGEEGVWRFMRARTDKQRPNAWHVYEKVMTSIQDNIEEDDIIAEVEEAMKSPVYEKYRPPGGPQQGR